MMGDAEKTKVANRLRRIQGQIGGIEKMIQEDRYCIDILTQISAVVSALRGVEDRVMQNHLNTCVADAMRSEDPKEQQEKVDEVLTVIGKFRKHG
jgi:CsoR family transcriptional regulator, copper-sensing transcriptional repressor